MGCPKSASVAITMAWTLGLWLNKRLHWGVQITFLGIWRMIPKAIMHMWKASCRLWWGCFFLTQNARISNGYKNKYTWKLSSLLKRKYILSKYILSTEVRQFVKSRPSRKRDNCFHLNFYQVTSPQKHKSANWTTQYRLQVPFTVLLNPWKSQGGNADARVNTLMRRPCYQTASLKKFDQLKLKRSQSGIDRIQTDDSDSECRLIVPITQAQIYSSGVTTATMKRYTCDR